MTKKSIVTIHKGTLETNEVALNKDNIDMLFKLEGKSIKLLFLILSSNTLSWNNNAFSIDFEFQMLAEEVLGLKASGVSLHCGKLAKNNIFRKRKNGVYMYNPHLFFYGDDSHKYECQEKWDNVELLSNTIKK